MPNNSPHSGHRDRMKKKFLKNGLESFADHEVLEFLLFYSISRQDTNPLGHELINKYGQLSNVFDANFDDLLTVNGISGHSATLIKLIPQLCNRYMEDKHLSRKPALRTFAEVSKFVVPLFIGKTEEELYIICMNKNCKVICYKRISRGTLDETSLNMRAIVDTVIKSNASRVLLAHNHPSGTSMPSIEDIDATEKVKILLESMEVLLDDHIIVAGNDIVSMQKLGHV